MLCCYTKQTIIKAIKMIVIKSKMKERKKDPLSLIRLIKQQTDDFFVCFNSAFPNRYTYPLLTLFDTQLLPKLKQKSNLNQSLENITLCCINVEKHFLFFLYSEQLFEKCKILKELNINTCSVASRQMVGLIRVKR